MLPEARPRVRQHDEDEVNPHGPEREYSHDAGDAAGLQYGATEDARGNCGRILVTPREEGRRRESASNDAGGRRGGRGGQGVRAVRDERGVLCGIHAGCGRCDYLDARDVRVLRRGEARGVVHHALTGDVDGRRVRSGRSVLREDEKPAEAEGGGVGRVDGGVDEVEPGEGEDLEGGLGAAADVGGEEGGEDEGREGVEIHRKLEGGEVVTSQEGEEPVETGELVDEGGEGNELGAGAEGHQVEERLGACQLSACSSPWESSANGVTFGFGMRSKEECAMVAERRVAGSYLELAPRVVRSRMMYHATYCMLE